MKKILGKLYIGLVFLFLYAPIFVLIVFSFNNSKSRSNFTGFTFKWYQELFSNNLIMGSLFNTLTIAVISSVFATILGTFAAIGIRNMKKTGRGIMMNITYLPVINPEIVTGVSLMLLFVFLNRTLNLQLGFMTVLLAHITFNVPYVILNVLPKLRQMDKHLYEAAQDLGCNTRQAFVKVVIPEIMPGIVSGFLMAFTFSLDDFVISYFTSGSSFQTLPVTIYSMIRRKINPQINALSAILFIVVLAVLVLMNIKDAKIEKRNLQKEKI
ncbi:MAG: potC [Oscillospiraceae bacterium]|jgi:spermidine/putrescine transport system permease protein|nr:potC [Oscillospiraceae bacterium]